MIPPLPPGDQAALQRRLDRDGCQEPLILWQGYNNIVVDGHKRLRYCRLMGYPFPVIEKAFADRDEVKRTILEVQARRCDLSPLAASCIRGKRYLEAEKHQGSRRDLTSANHQQKSLTSANPQHKSTAERLGAEFGSCSSTIRRDAKITLAFEQVVSNCGVQTSKLLLARDSGVTQLCVLELADLPVAEQKQFVADLQKHGGKLPRTRREKGRRPEKITITLETDAIVQALRKYLEAEEVEELVLALQAAMME